MTVSKYFQEYRLADTQIKPNKIKFVSLLRRKKKKVSLNLTMFKINSSTKCKKNKSRRPRLVSSGDSGMVSFLKFQINLFLV